MISISWVPGHPPGFKWGSCYSILSFLCSVLSTMVCLFVILIYSNISYNPNCAPMPMSIVEGLKTQDKDI